MNLADISKLKPHHQAAILADQARATEARERVMGQLGQPAKPVDMKFWHASFTPHSKEPWLPAKQLHAIPDPHYGPASGAKPKSPLLHAPVEPLQGETLYSGRVHVRITSYRRRLLDPDNLTAKWFLDACRYARLIRDDKPEDITYQVGQEKVASKEDERTEIVIEPISNGPV